MADRNTSSGDIEKNSHGSNCDKRGSGGGGGSPKCIFRWTHRGVGLSGPDTNNLRVPQKVAIGPYHHDDRRLMPMEHQKKEALRRVCQLSGKSERSFSQALEAEATKLLDQYDGLTRAPNNNFIQMMLHDGCFLLYFFFELGKRLDEYVEGSLSESSCRRPLNTSDDAVLIQDIHLLENQIPGLVFKVLIDVISGPTEGSSRVEFLHLLDSQRRNLLRGKKGCSTDSDPGSQEGGVRDAGKPRGFMARIGKVMKRFRDLFHPKDRQLENKLKDLDEVKLQEAAGEMLSDLRQTDKYSSLRSAKKFRARGVTFKKSHRDDGLSGVRFHKGGLYLPELVLNTTLEVVLTNMVAFESMHPESGTGITSFMSLMDILVDTAEDVSILGDAGVITNNLVSDDAAANMFNKHRNRGMCNPFDEVLRQVREYASYRPRRWWVHFKLTYLANPWTILSLIGALLLLLLTAVQTIYAILAFHRGGGDRDAHVSPPPH